MHKLVSKLVLYSELDPNGILAQMADICEDLERGDVPVRQLAARANRQAKHLLDIATLYGFDCNLWQDYLAFVLLTNENSFSLTAERRAMGQGSVTALALADFQVFRELFAYDFGPLEERLGTSVWKSLCRYQAVPKPERSYYRAISQVVRALSDRVAAAASAQEVLDAVCQVYRERGVGMFGLNRAFRIRQAEGPQGATELLAGSSAGTRAQGIEFVAINNTDSTRLADLVGYELQKEQLVANTEAFLRGAPANNVLLYGDAGTGKSTSVKALLNEYWERGLRVVEINKYQFASLATVISLIKNRNYRFIVFIDDLSFENDEVEYKFLKAVIEGGLESSPENVLIYATSNRRHLIRETWSDRADMEHDGDIHRSDTVQEKTSLAARFGVAINFGKPAPALYHEIVWELAHRQLPDPPEDAELFLLADRWAMRHGGVSGRAARQFVDNLAGNR